MDYTPKQPNQPAPSQPTYELKKDVTGKPPPKRGPQTITAVRYVKQEDGTETKQTQEIKVPYEPNPKCKRCYGRGYIGWVANTNQIIPCMKCFAPKRS